MNYPPPTGSPIVSKLPWRPRIIIICGFIGVIVGINAGIKDDKLRNYISSPFAEMLNLFLALVIYLAIGLVLGWFIDRLRGIKS